MADKLVKVWRTNGQEEWVLVHVEVQSQQERDFAERMFVYNYRLFDRYNRKVASFGILGDNRPAWRPDRFGYELWGTKIGIEFAAAKLLDYAADEAALEAYPNPFAVVVLAHLKPPDRRPVVIGPAAAFTAAPLAKLAGERPFAPIEILLSVHVCSCG
ncbi:MAG TPA: hypothetical protein VJ783_26775 [Pirellulales bacterium]|nr:hypothetical protein [Pirellulales bacterium]